MKIQLKKDSKTLFYLMLLGIGVFVIIILVTFNYLSSTFTRKSNELAQLKGQVQSLSSQQTRLIVAKQQVKKYSNIKTIVQQIVPQNKNQAATILDIINIAQQNGITLDSITLPSSSLGSSSIPSTAAVPSTSTKASAVAAAAAANSIAIATSQLTQVNGIPGVYILPIQIAVSNTQHAVSYSNFYNFINALQNNRLTSQINNITIQPSSSNINSITFSFTINIYIKPIL